MLAAVAALFSISALPTMGANPKPTDAMMKPIQAALAALNASNPSALSTGVYASNATVVDEFSAYTWSGPNAGVAWLNDYMKFSKKTQFANGRGSLMPVKYFNQSGDRAYIVVPANFSGTMKGKPVRETGTWTFTLQRSGNTWLILTETWGTVTAAM
jgi:hypothetical protein